MRVGLLGAVPYLAAFVAMQVNGGIPTRAAKDAGTPRSRYLIAAAGLLGPHRSTPLHFVLTRLVHHGGHVHCLSPDVLGDPDRNPEPVGRGGRSGNDQRRWQRRRLCRPLPVRLSEHSNGIIFVRAGPNGGLFTCRRAADAAH